MNWRSATAATCVCLTLVGALTNLAAQKQPDRAAGSQWPVEEIHGPALPFDATLDEGTNISLDVSPDGRTIVFDLLGDLYTLPISGGAAARLTSGPAFDRQPRFSPDGKRIAFVSDLSGTDNVWLADSDGGNPTQLTSEKAALFVSPIWTFDGQYILARNQGIVALPVSGGTGFKFQGGSAAAPSPEGRYIYFNNRGQGGWQVYRYDRKTEASAPITGGPGGSVRPLVSRDGRYLAYSKRVDLKQLLIIRDLRTGAERVVFDGLDRDAQDYGFDGEVMPGYAFVPDASAIVIAVGGKISRIDLATGSVAVIPFSAHVQMTLTKKVYVPRRIEDGERAALKMLRWTHLTPDGKRLVFGAAGKIFAYDPASRRAQPIVDGPGLEYSPAVSPDGRWIAYIAWSDEEGGNVYKAPLDGGAPTRLTASPGLFQNLAWSPNGQRLVLLQANRGFQNDETVSSDVRWLDTTREGPTHLVVTLPPRAIRRQAVRPQFDASGERVYFAEGADAGGLFTQHTDLVSAKLDGTDKRGHVRLVGGAEEILVSPDGRLVAFTQGHDVYVTAAPSLDVKGPAPVQVSALSRLSGDGGDFVAWSDAGRTLTWNWGPSFYRAHVEPDSGRLAASPEAIQIAVDLPRPRPSGSVLLKGARILTMTDRGVIERGDILIECNRVKAIGPSGTLAVTAGTTVINAAGKTILPGFVDVHAHYEYRDDLEIFPERNWKHLINLAYGVTTIRDPSARGQMIFTLAEMVDTGAMIGPRVYSTGDMIFGSPGGPVECCPPVNNLDEARRQVRRLKALGATSIKQYAQRQREQQQWVVEACREEGLVVTTHPLNRMETHLANMMDGHTGLEHGLSPSRIYKDVLALMERTGTYYSPTIVNNGQMDVYFHNIFDSHRDAKLRRFTPHARLDERRLRQLSIMPDDEYLFRWQSRAAAEIVRAGGLVVMGSHGNRDGLGAHWEIWGFVMGGMMPLDALRAATRVGAESLGLQQDIGSLAPGMMADLIVLDANPLDDIRNTEKIRFVMKNGVLWRGGTMEEVWPSQRPLGPFYWEREQYWPPTPKSPSATGASHTHRP